VSIDGGQPVQLSDVTANMPAISPDGKHIASFYWDERASPTQGVMVIPFAGGQPIKRFNIVPDAINGLVLRWSLDGRTLLALNDQLSNIWAHPLDGGKPAQLTNFHGDRIFNFAWSNNGQLLALARGRVTDDAVLISDLK
jgi:Tol biopolymer transport system component